MGPSPPVVYLPLGYTVSVVENMPWRSHIYILQAVSGRMGADVWPRSGLIEGKCFRGRGTATGSETIDCAHVGMGWKEGSWTDAKLREAERSRTRQIAAHRIAASMPSWRAVPTLARRRHGGGNTSHSHRFLRPYSNSQLPHRCGPSVRCSAKEIRVHSHTPHNIIPSVSAQLEITGEISFMIDRGRRMFWHVLHTSRFVDMWNNREADRGGRLSIALDLSREKPNFFFFLSLGTDKIEKM
jgi:hypothetical protein